MNKLVKDKALFELLVAKKYLSKMLFSFENKHDCIRVVKDSRKAQKALGNARQIMLEGHLKYCLRGKMKAINGNQEYNKIIQLLRN